MKLHRLMIFATLAFFVLSGYSTLFAQDAEHFQYEITDANMSIIIQAGTLDGESLVSGDEIAVFTQDGTCAGASAVTDEGFPVGVAAWGAEGDLDNGFQNQEEIRFRVWDREADQEWDAEISRVVAGNNPPRYAAFGFGVIEIAANRGPDVPQIEVSAVAHDFGEVRIARSEEWIFTVTNRGRETLVISAMDIDNEYFTVNFDGEVSIESRQSTDFTVTFAPDEEGQFEASLSITSNDPENEVVTIDLMGTGMPQIPPRIVPSVDRYNFGRVGIDGTREFILRLSNTGDLPLVISDVVSEEDAFSTTFEGEFEIPSGEQDQLIVTFAPREARAYAADLVIHSNDPNNGQLSIRLNGEGVEESDPVIAVDQDVIFFGAVAVNQMITRRIIITNENQGSGNLWVESIASDNNAFTTNFSVDPVFIRPGDQWYVDVTFRPNNVARFNGVLTITSNDPNMPEMEVVVVGEGVAAANQHFRFYQTDSNHSLLVLSTTLGNNNLVQGDEVAVFTPGGFCAGVGVVEQDGRTGVSAWADDVDTEDIIDGFEEGNAFSFKVWDARGRVEAWANPEFQQGPQVFTPFGVTILRLSADVPEPAPSMQVNDRQFYFGQVSIFDDRRVRRLVINNVGEGVLNIESIESDLNAFTTDFEGPVDLRDEILEVNITFEPSEEIDYTGRLTIISNDPARDIFYIDLFGVGVQEVREPVVALSAVNNFFGVLHLNEEATFVLSIGNDGGADLLIEDIEMEGSQAFSSNFPGVRRIVQPGNAYDLTITFRPGQAQEHVATFTITTNDLENEQVQFMVRGYGSAAADHFLHHPTNVSHRINVSEAILITLQDNRVPLTRGDEVALFTPDGLCAGHTVIEQAGEPFILLAHRSDANNAYRDGFMPGEEFTFVYWKRSTQDELDVRVTWTAGQQVFTDNGNSTVQLEADAIHDEAQISVDERILQYGVVRVNQNAQRVFRIRNIGGVDLTLTGAQTQAPFQAVFTHNFGNQNVVLGPDEFFDFEVTFRPAAARSYEGTVFILNNDPDEAEQMFPIYPCGMGSNFAGHYLHFESGVNHSIIIQNIDLGGMPPAIGDEIAVFTESGLCAGATIVQEPREAQGVPAFGDDDFSERAIEGFVDDEPIAFRIWKNSQQREYEPEVEFVNGPRNWTPNGFTVIRLFVPDVFGIIPVDRISVNESEEVAFDLDLNNAEGQFDFEWLNPNQYANIRDNEDVEFSFANNSAHFSWPTNFRDAGNYTLRFAAFNNDERDEISVFVTVVNVPRPPRVVEEVRAQIFGDDNEFQVDEDFGWTNVVDLDELFADDDNMRLIFTFNPNIQPNNVIEQQIVANTNVYRIRSISANWNGRVERVQLTAIQQMMAAQPLDDLSAAPLRDGPNRSLRSAGDNQPLPNRDLQTTFEFEIVVNPVNDAPVITAPAANARAFTINEGQELVVNFTATDVDQNDALRWDVTNNGGLPDGWEFEDLDNGNARFTWTPDFNAGRPAPYTPEFRVRDEADAQALAVLSITVRNVNRPPVVDNEIEDIEIDEDSFMDERPIIIADLREVFNDPDNDQLNFSIQAPQPPANLRLALNQGVLVFDPVANFNLPAGFNVTVRATDVPGGLFVQDQFQIVINPINDPPAQFNLQTPVNDLVISYDPDSLAVLNFTWSAAAQNQWELDTTRYHIVFAIEGIEDTLASGELRQLAFSAPIDSLFTTLGLERTEDTWVYWRVWARDDEHWVLASNADFRFLVPALDVKDQVSGIPEDYYFNPMFPNPFNSATTIQFGLPVAGQVEVSVWDMHGRRVEVLVSGEMPAGRFEAVWDATRMTSGIYLIRINSGNYVSMQKAILVR